VEAENWAYSNSNLAVATQVNGWLSRLSKVCSTVSQFIISPTASILKYQPLDSEQCRSLLEIPTGKKVLMFAAEKLNDPRKGGDLILKVLQSLPESLKAETYTTRVAVKQ